MHWGAKVGLGIIGVVGLMVIGGNLVAILDPEGTARRSAERAAPAPTSTPGPPTRVPTSVVTIVSVPRQPTPRPTTVPGIPTGTELRISTEGVPPQIHLAIDEQARDEWRDFLITNDQPAMRRMIAAGHVFAVADRTRVITLEHLGPFSTTTHVRVLEGEHAGREGWVQSSFIRTN